jgi:hypothetical protein
MGDKAVNPRTDIDMFDRFIDINPVGDQQILMEIVA